MLIGLLANNVSIARAANVSGPIAAATPCGSSANCRSVSQKIIPAGHLVLDAVRAARGGRVMITFMLPPIIIQKLNLDHKLLWSYTGHVLERTPTYIRLEAHFNRATTDYGYAVFERGDRFVEHFFADRWYNIFEVHSVQDDHLKGWYCNIARPAVFSADDIAQVDLALDLWIKPDGSYQALDQAEFDALELELDTYRQARRAVDELLDLVSRRVPPFNSVA